MWDRRWVTADRPLVAALRAEIATAGDPVRAAAQQRYMKSSLPYAGVTTAELDLLLKPHLRNYRPSGREQWQDTVRLLWDGVVHREEWYAAIDLARHHAARDWLDPESLTLWRHLVITGAWWDVVDEIAAHLVGSVLAHHRSLTTPAIRHWARDPDPWIRRTAVLSQLRHKGDTDTALLADTIEASIDDSSFWLRKAIGWALREYAYTDPEWVRAFVVDHPSLSPLSRREALKRIGP